MPITLLHADRQHKANSRFLVTAVSVDNSQNAPSILCVIALARVAFRLICLDRQLFLISVHKFRKNLSQFLCLVINSFFGLIQAPHK